MVLSGAFSEVFPETFCGGNGPHIELCLFWVALGLSENSLLGRRCPWGFLLVVSPRLLSRPPSNPQPLIANAGFESTLRPHLTLIIHNLTKEFLRSPRSEVKLAGIFCATLR